MGNHTSGRSRAVQWREPCTNNIPASKTNKLNNEFITTLKKCTRGRRSKGKTIFLTRLTLDRIRLGAAVSIPANRLNVIIPIKRVRAKVIRVSPDCTPHRALNTTEKTKVYTASIKRGWIKAYPRPIKEPLYRTITSRHVS